MQPQWFAWLCLLASLALPGLCQGKFYLPVGKCCERHKVLRMTSNGLKCASAEFVRNELFETNYGFPPLKPSYPSCKNIAIKEVRNENQQVHARCLDMFYTDMSSAYAGYIVALTCEDEEDMVGDNRTALINPRSSIVRLRTCCAENEAFDYGTRTCSATEDAAKSPSLIAIVGQRAHFVAVYRGGPYCANPMIDYEVTFADLRIQNGLMQVHIPLMNKTFDMSQNVKVICLARSTSSPSLLTVRICWEENHCEDNACVRKCCLHDESFDFPNCIPNAKKEDSLHAAMTKTDPAKFQDFAESNIFDITAAYGLLTGLTCPYGKVEMLEEDWKLTADGSVEVSKLNKLFSHDNYCIDLNYNPYFKDFTWVMLTCVDRIPWTFEKTNVLIASCCFMALTLIYFIYCYGSQTEVEKNVLFVYRKCLICTLTCSFDAYMLLMLVDLKVVTDRTVFTYIGFVTLFFMLSRTSWLTIMYYDNWKLLRKLVNRQLINSQENKNFRSYCLLSWGSPLSFILHNIVLKRVHFFKIVYGTDVELGESWFEPGNNFKTFSYTIPMVLYSTMSLIFLLSSTRMYKKASQNKPLLISLDELNIAKERFFINMKLFMVTAAPAYGECIYLLVAWFHNFEYSETDVGPILDFFGAFEGVIIFIVLIAIPKMCNLLGRVFIVKESTHQVVFTREPVHNSDAFQFDYLPDPNIFFGRTPCESFEYMDT